MQAGEFYRDKDIKHIFLRVVEVGNDGWCRVIFNFQRLSPNVFNYHQKYIEAFYQLHQD